MSIIRLCQTIHIMTGAENFISPKNWKGSHCAIWMFSTVFLSSQENKSESHVTVREKRVLSVIKEFLNGGGDVQ